MTAPDPAAADAADAYCLMVDANPPLDTPSARAAPIANELNMSPFKYINNCNDKVDSVMYDYQCQ